MIPIEGRIALGLDEFMLRLGHIKLLCRTARGVRGSLTAIQREVAATLKKEVDVPAEYRSAVAQYLRQRRLCPVRDPRNPSEADSGLFRYPELELVERDGFVQFGDQSRPIVWQQDLWFSDPHLKSRVGAITLVRGKGSSKTGLSHVLDWGSILDVITGSGDLTAEGHLLGAVRNKSDPLDNPYIIGPERIIFGFLTCQTDFDVFSRFLVVLSKCITKIRKRTGVEYFRSAINVLAEDADAARNISLGQRSKIMRLTKEAGSPESSSPDEKAGISMAWHRASSRLETYVDLGLLEKGVHDEAERYEYVYYPASSLKHAAETLQGASSADQWVDDHLLQSLSLSGGSHGSPRPEEVLPLLPALAKILRRPPSLLPITALAVGVATMFADRGRAATLGEVRSAVENIALMWPERARLSRGAVGKRAEFISVDLKGVEDDRSTQLFC